MSKPVRWTETWEGLLAWHVLKRPRPKWEDGILRGLACQWSPNIRVFRDTPSFRDTLVADVRSGRLKRVKVTITVEEVTDGDAG